MQLIFIRKLLKITKFQFNNILNSSYSIFHSFCKNCSTISSTYSQKKTTMRVHNLQKKIDFLASVSRFTPISPKHGARRLYNRCFPPKRIKSMKKYTYKMICIYEYYPSEKGFFSYSRSAIDIKSLNSWIPTGEHMDSSRGFRRVSMNRTKTCSRCERNDQVVSGGGRNEGIEKGY